MSNANKKHVHVSMIGGALTVNPVRLRILSIGEQVEWVCTGCKMDIDFKMNANGHQGPFQKPHFHSDNTTPDSSDEPTVVIDHARYDYTMTVTPDPTTNNPHPHNITIDPEVVIDDSGPPDPDVASGKLSVKKHRTAIKKPKHKKKPNHPKTPKQAKKPKSPKAPKRAAKPKRTKKSKGPKRRPK